jgi:catechol 2,3-dioxygenase-like lactoylglutathione lyase family enzyme
MRCSGSLGRAELEEVGRDRPKLVGGDAASARLFYEELLGGREVWPTGRRAGFGRLWFLLGETLVEAGPTRGGTPEVVEVEVASPNDTAARCWDAGYTVQLSKHGTSGGLSVIDPFGRPIALVSRRSALDAEAAG